MRRLLVGLGICFAVAGPVLVVLPAPTSGQQTTTPTTTAQQVAGSLGPWSHRLDPENRGQDSGWSRGVPGATATTLPDVPNAWPIAGAAGRRNETGSIGWWDAPVVLATAGDYAVRVGSANHDATVWLDGRRLCTHRGAYEPFTCPFTASAGRHRLVIRADWRDPAAQRRQGYDRAWFNWGGLAWPVSVVPRGATRLALTAVRTTLHGDDADLRLAIASAGTPEAVTAVLRQGARAYSFTVPAGGGVVTVRIPHAQLWSPASPTLSDLTLTVGGDPAATLHRRIGLREITWSDGHLRLNGAPLHLPGAGLPPDAARHGDGLTAADQDRLVDELKAIGANATRTQLPLSDELLGRLDAAGILVWQALGPFDHAGNFQARTPALRADARRRALATADREASHPSVLTWNLANEVSGQGNPAGQAAYIDALAQELHRRDPGRPVAADLWEQHLPKRAGLLHRHLDLVGLTEYIGFSEAPYAPAAQQDALVRTRVALLRRLFATKPIVVTEFGANANGENPTASPGGYRYQAMLLARRARLYRRLGIAGALAWVLRDYAVTPDFRGGATLAAHLPGVHLAAGRNEKGLFRMDGTAKPGVAALRAVTTG